ncbi:MAG: imidazolonepropionase [candidate division WOR-3 bacterium]
MQADLLIKNIGELVYFENKNLKTLTKAALVIENGKIADFGPEREILDKYKRENIRVIDVEGKSVIPAFVDPHTHLIYAGCRHEEFLAKLKGKDYVELLKEGKGINYTVSLTRKESKESLYSLAFERLYEMQKHGTLTVEIKSGYGLNYETEKKMLETARLLRETSNTCVITTFLGAHAIPPEFTADRKGYIREITQRMLPDFKSLATFVDIFIDKGAFTVEEAYEILSVANNLGYKIKMHIDELSYTGACKLVREFDVISCEHMEYTKEEDLIILKEKDVTCVLLPGTYFFMRATQKPLVSMMRELGLSMALGTDHNPGTSPFYSQSLIMAMGVFLYNMSVEEALMGVTTNAAKALGIEEKKGNIKIGMDADILILNTHSFVHLVYEVGRNLIDKIIKSGRIINIRST